MENTSPAPDSFPHYPQAQPQIPPGLTVADPRAHKPLYKMMKLMLKPRVKTPRIKHKAWAKKKKYY